MLVLNQIVALQEEIKLLKQKNDELWEQNGALSSTMQIM